MNHFGIVIFGLIEEDYRRNHLRIQRRRLRDMQDPFDMAEERFIKNYRLTRALAHQLIERIEPYAIISTHANAIPFRLKVIATLNFLAVGSYQTPVGLSAWANMSQSCVSRSIEEICGLVTNNLMNEEIKFPLSIGEKLNIKRGFYEKWQLPGIIGAIDGTHVEIIAPSVNNVNEPPFVYINRKGRYSINVMLICDSNCKILGASARFLGSVHDAAIWQVSNIRRLLERQFENGERNSFLIGDSGYGLEPWLLTPYANPIPDSRESRFNHIFRSARNVIERTNGILKARFRCLLQHRVLHYTHRKAADIIYTCCVLHNMCLAANLPFEEEIEIEDDLEDNGQVNNHALELNERINMAREIRDNYVNTHIV